MKIANSHGKIFYGLHFYPGVAEYKSQNEQSYRVFLNEDTLRKMDPSFAGRPIFVQHVDEVNPDLNKLREESEGWVIESFFNAADGKHWVKFILVTEHAERSVRNGFRLSNAYVPKAFKEGGLWNGVPYLKEITDAEYDHLALVKDPRYEESIILTPDEFKQYNEEKMQELKKISNSNKGMTMKFNFFKRTKVENAIDPELQIVLPKSGRAVSVQKLINDAYEKDQDEAMDKKKDGDDDPKGESGKHHAMANMDHMVKMHDGSYMKLKDMMNKFKSISDDLEEMKGLKKDDKDMEEIDVKPEKSKVYVEGDKHNDPASEHGMDEHEEEVEKEEHQKELNDDVEHPEAVVHDDEEDDKDAKKKALQLAEHEDKEIEAAKKKNLKKKNSIEGAERAERLRTAHLRQVQNEVPENYQIDLPYDRVNRGKARYGS